MDLAAGLRRGNEEPSRRCAGVQAPVPDRDDEVGVGDSQGAGKVHGVRAPQRVPARKQPGVPLHGRSELDRADGRPVLIEGLLGKARKVTSWILARPGNLARSDQPAIRRPAR